MTKIAVEFDILHHLPGQASVQIQVFWFSAGAREGQVCEESHIKCLEQWLKADM